MLTRGREARARASPDPVLSPLPRCFIRAVFLLLPVDRRLRCCEVNRAWRALLADTSFWTCLDLSSTNLARFSLPLLRAAVSKAGGQLRALDVTGRLDVEPSVHLIELVAANASSLTDLCVDTITFWPAEVLRDLHRAGPKLKSLRISLFIDEDHQHARALLRNEPPFQALRLRRLFINDCLETTADVVAFCSDVRCHTSLEELLLSDATLDTAAMGAVVDACIALRLPKLRLDGCCVVPAMLPELTRLVAAGTVREISVHNDGVEMFDEAHESMRLFVAAVRASAMTRLVLTGVPTNALPEIVAEAAALINARSQ